MSPPPALASDDREKSAALISVVFTVLALLFAENTKAASTVTAFDGTWSVTVKAPEYKNPVDGTVTRAVSATYPAKVKNGVLHGWIGTRARW